MACCCSWSRKIVRYAIPELFTDLQDGTPTGSFPSLSAKAVFICTECWTAEFLIPESEHHWFHAGYLCPVVPG